MTETPVKKLSNFIKIYLDFYKGVRRFLFFLKPYRKLGYIAAIFMALSVFLEMPMPFLTMYLIDNIIPEKNLSLLNIIAVGLLFVLFLKSLSLFFYKKNLIRYKTRVLFDIRRKLVEKVMSLSFSRMKELSPGYMVSRIDGDVDQLEGLMAETFIGILKNLITFLVGTGILFFFNVKMAAAAFLLLPLFVWAMHHYGVKINKLTEVLREKWADFTREIEEVLEGGISLKSRGREFWGVLRFCISHIKALKKDVETEITWAISGIVLDVIGSLAPLVILWLGIREIIIGNLSLGGFFAFNSFLVYLYGPVSNLVDTNVDIHSTLASADRVFEILGWEEEKSDGIELKSIGGDILFNDVSFSYGNGSLFMFDFYIRKGEKVAIVGESGSGKSTLFKLLMGYEGNYKGDIYIDGINIKEIDIKSLRERIGYVGSENFIFSGTISENISLCYITDKSNLMRSINMADCEGIIRNLPDGVNEQIGRDGRKLSTGETQRIFIARALYGEIDMLLLDEATSAVDLLSEKKIYDMLVDEFEDKTVMVISHRIESVRNFERIFFIDGGTVSEMGTFDELINLRRGFYKLYNSQRRIAQYK